MDNSVINKLLEKYSNRFVSTWLILLSDMGIVFVSFYMANLMRYDFAFTSINILSIITQSFLVLGTYLLFFLTTKSYRGIIRYSGINDTVRLFKATGFSTVTLLLLAILTSGNAMISYWIPSYSIILMQFLLSLIFLVSSRFLVRSVYHEILNKDPRIILKVLIYGAGAAGMQTRNALRGDSTYKHEVIAFLDDNERFLYKILEGVPVITPQKGLTEDYIRHHGINLLILAIPGLSLTEKRRIIDKGLGLGLKVKVVPSINQWINGQLSSSQLREVKIEELL